MRNMKRDTTNGRFFIITSGSDHYISVWIDKYVANCCENTVKLVATFIFQKWAFGRFLATFIFFVVSFLSKNGRF